MEAENIDQIPCPLCKSMIRSRQTFEKQYMELCEHCKHKFAFKFCVCKKITQGNRPEKYPASYHQEQNVSRGRRGVDKDWIKLSPEQKLLQKHEIFYKNMYDFFRHFQPRARTEPKYKIRPLLDDRLYGNEDFFKNIGPSFNYDSVRYDDRTMSKRYKYQGPLSDDEPYLSDQYRYYGTNRGMDDQRPIVDRYSFLGATPVMDDQNSFLKRPEYYGGLGTKSRYSIISERHSEYSGPLKDRQGRVIESSKIYHKRYHDDPVMDDYKSDSERHERRERHHKRYGESRMDDHRYYAGTFKYVEKSPEVEKFKEYIKQVKEQQRKNIKSRDKLRNVVKQKPALNSPIRSKIKSDRDSQKRESLKEGKKEKSERKQSSENKKDTGKDSEHKSDKENDKSARDTAEAVLKALESNEGIVPIKEAALHIDELDKRTSNNQAKKIEERLQEVAQKRRKPIIVEFIKRKKKSPRVRQGARSRFSHLDSLRSLKERKKKENIEPEKISEIDAFNVSSCQELGSIIIGPKIYHYKAPLKDSGEPNLSEPLVYKAMPVVKSKLEFMPIPDLKSRKEEKNKTTEETTKIVAPPLPTTWDDVAHTINDMSTDGIISYALSDRRFIDKGWSKLPTEHIVRRMNIYRMRPTHPDFDWFERNKCNEQMLFESGEKFAEFNNEEGRCQIFYKNGKIALDHYRSEEPLSQKRIVIYSKGEPYSFKKPQSILAIFDHLGSGVVFDNKGKIRLKFNQTEGIVLDKSLGPKCHWEWHSLNDPPQLKHIMVDTNLIYKDQDIFKEDDRHNVPKRQVDEEVHAIELDNIVKEKKKKMTIPYKRFPIKIKSVKINDQFTLLIIDQATIYLKFKEGSTFFKTNIGLILDQNEIVDTVTEKLGAVMNSVERRPAPTESLAALQRTVLKAQRDDKRFMLRERRINRPADYYDNIDRVMTLISKPLRKEASCLKPFVCDCSLSCTCVNA